MSFRHLVCLTFLLCNWLMGQRALAYTTTIAMTGGDASGVPLATWGQFDYVSLSNAGELAFRATMQHAGDVDSNNDTGVWRWDDAGVTLVTRTGSGNVPGVSDADFSSLATPRLSDSGEVIVGGKLPVGTNGVTSSNDEGLWRYDTAGGELLARTGSGGVPEVANANFLDLINATGATNIVLAENGDVAVRGRLEIGVGGVVNDADRGLWKYTTGGSSLLVREGSFNVPGIPGASFSSFGSTTINSNDQLATLASLKSGGGVSIGNEQGIWRYSGATGELIARRGSSNVPDRAGVDFLLIGSPHMSESGEIAFNATLSDQSAGVWLFDGAAGELVIAQGDSAPGVPGAEFSSSDEFLVTDVNDAGQVLVSAFLEEGVAGVTSDNRQGLWLLSDEDGLVARSGVGNVPGLPEANFESFADTIVNENGHVVFTANLESGTGGVDSSNNEGLWLVDSQGEGRLVARTGDELAGRTVASLTFVGNDSDYSSGFNDHGEIAFQASFTNGDSGLFLYRPYAADFDRDGNVDADDLSEWAVSYAVATSADADADGDSDGADFLAWQREDGRGGVIEPITAVVPEPTSVVLLCTGLLCCCRRD